MEIEEFRKVHVKHASNDNDGNLIEKHVVLKNDDPFEDNDLVKVISKDEYTQLVDNSSFDEIISKKDAEIITLTDDTGYEITLPFYVLERMADQDREKRRS